MALLIKDGEVMPEPNDQLANVVFTAEFNLDPMNDEFEPSFLQRSLFIIEIENFNDGRVFTFLRLLRTRYQYQGELRIKGEYLIDQMAMLMACGADSFLLPEGSDYEHALFILSNTPENTF